MQQKQIKSDVLYQRNK